MKCWSLAGKPQLVPPHERNWLKKTDGRRQNQHTTLELIGRSTIRLTQGNRLLRDIIPLPMGETLVLEPWDETEATKPAHECRWKLASGPPDAWRYACIVDRADGSLHPLD